MSYRDDLLWILDVADEACMTMRGSWSLTINIDHERNKPTAEAYLDADWWTDDSERFSERIGRFLDPDMDDRLHCFDGVIKAEFAAGTITLRRRNSGMRQSWEPVVVHGQERAA